MKCGLQCRHLGFIILLPSSIFMVFAYASSSPYCTCDIAPQFLKLDERMPEHSGIDGAPPTFTKRLYMSTCPCALYRKDLSKEEPTIGEWSITRLGEWTFVLKPHKYGVVRLYFIVEDPNSSKNASAHIKLTVVQNPDAPQAFLNIDDKNVVSENNTVEIFTEQNSDNGDYEPFVAAIGAFDYDLNDVMTILVTSPPLHGTATISLDTNLTLSRALSCPTSSPASSTLVPTTLPPSTKSVSYNPDSPSLAIIPCDFKVPYPPNELIWTSARLEYVPKPNFYGNDTFSVIVADQNTAGTVVQITVIILNNPCRNGATCRGPADDLECRHRRRQYQFLSIGYKCTCTRGWIDSVCSTDFDDCLSSPCPPYRICRDRLNGYDCVCPANLKHCDPLLNSWQTALVVIITGIFICLITVGLILLSRRRNAQFLDAMWRF